MTPDLLAALRETPGCGEDPECITRHTLAVHHADECNPCLTRLAEAVIEQVVARLTDPHLNLVMAADDSYQLVGDSIGLRPDKLVASLLAALRSETPR